MLKLYIALQKCDPGVRGDRIFYVTLVFIGVQKWCCFSHVAKQALPPCVGITFWSWFFHSWTAAMHRLYMALQKCDPGQCGDHVFYVILRYVLRRRAGTLGKGCDRRLSRLTLPPRMGKETLTDVRPLTGWKRVSPVRSNCFLLLLFFKFIIYYINIVVGKVIRPPIVFLL